MVITVVVLYIFFGVCLVNADTLSKSFTLSSDVQQYVLQLHNDFRSQVAKGSLGSQPSATNMQAMKWDPTLEAFAQNWTNQCPSVHSTKASRKAITGYWYVGENMAGGGLLNAMASDQDLKDNFKKSVDMWSGEYSAFTYPNTCSATCLHYTQLQVTWATSNNLGCAIAQCTGADGSLNWLVVCNYGPGGNIQQYDANGKLFMPAPYVSGTTCSACPQGATTCSTNGLCN